MTDVIDLDSKRKQKAGVHELPLSPEAKERADNARIDIKVFLSNMISMGVGYICTNYVQDGVVYHLHMEAVADDTVTPPPKKGA